MKRIGPAGDPRSLPNARVSADAALMGVTLPDEAAHRLQAFLDLLTEKGPRLGLIADSDAGRIYERHVRDSLRAAAVFRSSDRLAYDLGSGAGLPGVVLAVVLPACRFRLVEPRRRRVAFLELAVERLELSNAEIVQARVEDLPPDRADVATARAYAALPEAWRGAGPLLRRGGRLVYYAGRSLADPLGAGLEAEATGHPATLALDPVLATSVPLVIMTRK